MHGPGHTRLPLFVSLLSVAAGVPAIDVLEPQIVSALRDESLGVPTAGSISVVTRQEIERSGARHVTEVLRARGGVQLTDLYGDGSRAQVSMRGFGANGQANTLVLVDGRRLNNTDLAPADLNTISLEDVERIEIIQGSSGVLFGDQAVGGVINIITRRPAALEAGVEAGFGSYARNTQRAYAANAHDNGIRYRATFERSSADNYRDNNEIRYGNGLGQIGWDGVRGGVFLEFQRIDEDVELPGGLFASQVRADREQTRFPTDYADSDTEIARIGGGLKLHANWTFRMEATSRDADIAARLTGFDLDQARNARAVNPRLLGRYGLAHGDLILTLGSDVEDNDYSLESAFGRTRAESKVRSVYAQAVAPLAPRVSVTAGVRQASLDTDIVDTFAFPAGAERDDDQLLSSLGLSVTPADAVRFFVKREENYRFPLVDEQTFLAFGDTGLETQTGVSYETGLEWARGPHAAKVLVYRLKLEDEIDFDPSVGFFGANTNLDPTARTGVILEGTLQALERLTLAGQYSWVDARFDAGVFAGNHIPFVAEHQGRVSATYLLPGGVTAYGEVLAVSERHASGDYANALDDLPGYALVNLHLDYAWRGFSAGLRINNVLDKEYSDYAATDAFLNETAYYPAPERNVFLTLGYRYD